MNFQDLEKVPSPPGVAVKLLELFASPDVSIDELNDVIGADPTLTARIVKYVNSPVFARRHEASSLRQAITMLGANGVKMIALSFSLTNTSAESGSENFDFDQFWNMSLATAVCAKSIFKSASQDGDVGFLIGLLLNVGQMAMYCTDTEKYETILENKMADDLDLVEIETREFGENRYAFGREVLKAWNFPSSMIEALDNFSKLESVSFESKALTLANQMRFIFLNDSHDYEMVKSFNEDLGTLLNLEADATEELFTATINSYSEIASILAYDCPQQKSLKEIELEAKTRIVEMTMDLHMANAQVTQENSELKDMAFVDTLTGLGNRRQYESIASAELARCSRMKRPFCLLVIDIDRFKQVNDTYGHAAGDAILAGVAKRLEAGLRSYDFVFRYGGEEFVLVLPESVLEDCRAVANRLRESIAADPFHFEDQSIPVTISMGGKCCEDEGLSDELADIFKQADESLYTAKQTGRNRVIFTNDPPAAVATAVTGSIAAPTVSPNATH